MLTDNEGARELLEAKPVAGSPLRLGLAPGIFRDLSARVGAFGTRREVETMELREAAARAEAAAQEKEAGQPVTMAEPDSVLEEVARSAAAIIDTWVLDELGSLALITQAVPEYASV